MDHRFLTSPDGLFLYHHRLAADKWLRHGFSLRRSLANGRDMNVGFNSRQPRETAIENRQRLVEAVFQRNHPLVLLRQVHADTVIPVECPPAEALEGDALVTCQSGMVIAVQTADCLPVLLADPVQRVIAAVHAGWRGTLKRIVQKAVERMRSDFNSNPADCLAVVGPSIRGCCYEVGEEVVEAFFREFSDTASLFSEPPAGKRTRPAARTLDLPLACQRQLLAAGLRPENIAADGPCTSCRTDLFFSHRAEGGNTGRMLALIGITAEP